MLPEGAVSRVVEILTYLEDNVIVGDVEAQHLGDDEEATGTDAATEAGGDTAAEAEEEAEPEAVEETEEGEGVEAGEGAATTAANAEAHVHTPGEWMIVISPSCGSQGARQQFCTECNALLASEFLPASGNHIRGHWVTIGYGACNYEGAEQEECPNCGAVFDTRSTGYGEHTYSGGYCVVCGQKDPSYSPATTQTVSGGSTCSHSWRYTRLDEDDTQNFSHQKDCLLCGQSEIESCIIDSENQYCKYCGRPMG